MNRQQSEENSVENQLKLDEDKFKNYDEILQNLKNSVEFIPNHQNQCLSEKQTKRKTRSQVAKLEQQNESHVQFMKKEIYHRDKSVKKIIDIRNKIDNIKELNCKFVKVMKMVEIEQEKMYAGTNDEIFKQTEEQTELKNKLESLTNEFKSLVTNIENFENEKLLQAASSRERMDNKQKNIQDFESSKQELINQINYKTLEQTNSQMKLNINTRFIEFVRNRIEKTKMYRQELQNKFDTSTMNCEKIETLKTEIKKLENDYRKELRKIQNTYKMKISNMNLYVDCLKNINAESIMKGKQEQAAFKKKEINNISKENRRLEKLRLNFNREKPRVDNTTTHIQECILNNKKKELKEIQMKNKYNQEVLKLQALICKEHDSNKKLSYKIECNQNKIANVIEKPSTAKISSDLNKKEKQNVLEVGSKSEINKTVEISNDFNTIETDNNAAIDSINEMNKNLKKYIDFLEIQVKNSETPDEDKLKKHQKQKNEIILNLSEKAMLIQTNNERVIELNELYYKNEMDKLMNLWKEFTARMEQKKEEHKKIQLSLETGIKYLTKINEIEEAKIQNMDDQISKEIVVISSKKQDIPKIEPQIKNNIFGDTSFSDSTISNNETFLNPFQRAPAKLKSCLKRKAPKKFVRFADDSIQKSDDEIFDFLPKKKTKLETRKDQDTI